ncbi:MAG TPA: hypothetical protein VIY90_05060 [Steroidobacteraceae bacterium]
MIIHASIPADDPQRVARVIAELWRGTYAPFPIVPGVFTARAGDERGTQIEVGPRGREAIPGEKQLGMQVNPAPSPYSEVHLNIFSPLSEAEIFAIAKREGWKALPCDRGGVFKLIEFWLENKFMLEVMNEHEWARYKTWDHQGAPVGPPGPRV